MPYPSPRSLTEAQRFDVAPRYPLGEGGGKILHSG